MTKLEELIKNQTTISTTIALQRKVDDTVNELAKEILKDKEFMDEMKQLMREAFKITLQELGNK